MIDGLTKTEALQKCRDMWNRIADKTEKERRIVYKEEYFIELGIDDIPTCSCYCCEYDCQQEEDSCANCPLDFPKGKNGKPDCAHKSSPFYLWSDAIVHHDWESAAKYARELANLPENPDCK